MAKKHCIFIAYRDPMLQDTLRLWGDLRSYFTADEDVIITQSDNNDGNYNIDRVVWVVAMGYTEVEIPLNSLAEVQPFPWTTYQPCPGVQYNETTGKVMYNATTKKVQYVAVSKWGYGEPE